MKTANKRRYIKAHDTMIKDHIKNIQDWYEPIYQ